MNLSLFRSLADGWRGEAELFRRRGREGDAQLIESFASELEGTLRRWELETLTLEQAAEETGRSYSHFQHRVGDGTIPNAGTKGAPRIARRDLYLRVGRAACTGEPDLAAEVLTKKRI